MDKQRRAQFQAVITGLVRDDELGGRPHLVVPTVLVREMVLGNNGDGQLLPRETIAESAELKLWNNKPVTLGHPAVGRGFGLVGDMSPEMFQNIEVGRLWNVHEKNGKLKAEAWIDVELANRTELGQELVRRLEAHRDGVATEQMIEGSTGYLAMLSDEAGIFNGKRFRGVQSEIIPDHFAVLLDRKGKCSVEDGCGLPRLNSEGEPCDCHANADGLSDADLRELLQTALTDVESDAEHIWVEAVFENAVVYELSVADGPSRTYERNYTLDGESVALGGDRQEVVKDVSFKPVQQANEDGIARRVLGFISNAFSAAAIAKAFSAEANEKGQAGEGTGGAARSALGTLASAGMSFEEISSALDGIGNVEGEDVTRTAGVLSSISRGEIENPPQSLVDALESIDPPEQEEETNMDETIDALVEIEGFPLSREQLNELDDDRVGKLAQAWNVASESSEEEAGEEDDSAEAAEATAGEADPEPEPEANAAQPDGLDVEAVANAFGAESVDEAKHIFEIGRAELNRRDSERQELAKQLAANQDCDFGLEELSNGEQWPLDKLRKLETTVRKPVYMGGGGPRRREANHQPRAQTPAIVTRKPATN